MFQQPSSTPYDLYFQFAGTPVRVQPMFWLSALLLGSRGSAQQLLVFVAVMFVSVLVHELGHAVAIRYFGWEPSITLHGFGGVATYHAGLRGGNRRTQLGLSPWGQIVIAAAGPLAGIGLAGCVILGLLAANRSFPLNLSFFSPQAVFMVGRGPLLEFANQAVLWDVINDMLFMNIFWSLINLLPILPLDGGHIAQNLLVASRGMDGHRQAYWLSGLTGALFAILSMSKQEHMMAVFFALLAYRSFQAAQQRNFEPW
ncbi:MAG: site-2 protease family protein [Pirellulales bacterium]